MKATKFTDAQKAFVIKQGEVGMPVAEICRKAGISQATYFNWQKKPANEEDRLTSMIAETMRKFQADKDGP